MAELVRVDIETGSRRCRRTPEHFAGYGDKVPQALRDRTEVARKSA